MNVATSRMTDGDFARRIEGALIDLDGYLFRRERDFVHVLDKAVDASARRILDAAGVTRKYIGASKNARGDRYVPPDWQVVDHILDDVAGKRNVSEKKKRLETRRRQWGRWVNRILKEYGTIEQFRAVFEGVAPNSTDQFKVHLYSKGRWN